MINIFYKYHPEKPTAMFPLIDSIPLMAKLLAIKQKRGQLMKPTKWAKKTPTRNRLWNGISVDLLSSCIVTIHEIGLREIIRYWQAIRFHLELLFFLISKCGIDVTWFNPAYYRHGLKAINNSFYLFLSSYQGFISILPHLPVFFDGSIFFRKYHWSLVAWALLFRSSVIRSGPFKRLFVIESGPALRLRCPINYIAYLEFLTQYQKQQIYLKCTSFHKKGRQTVGIPYSWSQKSARNHP